MKGGTATKILLDVMSLTALSKVYALPSQPLSSDSEWTISELDILSSISRFERAKGESYLCVSPISKILDMVGSSLRNDAKVHSLSVDGLGIMAAIDASEMFDTYGLAEDCISAYFPGGWASMDKNIQVGASAPRLDWTYFEDSVVPTITAEESVLIAVPTDPSLYSTVVDIDRLHRIIEVVKTKTQKIALMSFGVTALSSQYNLVLESAAIVAEVSLTQLGLCPGDVSLLESAAKYVYNTITTGACVKKGCVYRNRMINMGISNNKLYHRAIAIIQSITECSSEMAEASLLRSIHRSLSSKEIPSLPLSEHITIATPMANVLPIAVLVAGGCSVSEAQERLRVCPVLRDALSSNV